MSISIACLMFILCDIKLFHPLECVDGSAWQYWGRCFPRSIKRRGDPVTGSVKSTLAPAWAWFTSWLCSSLSAPPRPPPSSRTNSSSVRPRMSSMELKTFGSKEMQEESRKFHLSQKYACHFPWCLDFVFKAFFIVVAIFQIIHSMSP